MIPALLGFTCEVSPGVTDFLKSQIPTPLLGFALLLYWRGTVRFKKIGSISDRATFWQNNIPTWAAYFFATASMGIGLTFYALGSL